MRTLFIAFVAVAVLAIGLIPPQKSAVASNVVWSTTGRGFTFSNGYWFNGAGQKFTRSKVFVNTGRGHGYWTFKFVPVVVKKRKVDFRQQLVDLANEKTRLEANAIIASLEHQELLLGLKVLGLSSFHGFNANAYGVGAFNNGYGHVFNQGFGGTPFGTQLGAQFPTAQGNTIYGYSNVADVYGDVNLQGLYEQAIRLAQDANRFGAQATQRAQTLIAQESEWRARVAQILANAKAAEAARVQGPKQSNTYILQMPKNGTDQPTITPTAPAQPNNSTPFNNGAGLSGAHDLQSLVQARCAKCHGNDRKEGGLDLQDLSKISPDQGTAVLERIIEPDAGRRMPPQGETQLTVSELLLFFNAAQASN